MYPTLRRSSFHRSTVSYLLLALLAIVVTDLGPLPKSKARSIAAASSTTNRALPSANVPMVAGSSVPSTPKSEIKSEARLRERYGNLPISFEANQGQTDGSVKFLSRGSGYSLFLTPTEAVLRLRMPDGEARNQGKDILAAFSTKSRDSKSAALRLKFAGANPAPKVVGAEQLPGKVNYLIGNDSSKWRHNVPTYSKVTYSDVYPGVDLVYYGNQGQLEYDFVVRPGTDPRVIALDVQGADGASIDAQGDLVLRLGGHEVRQRKPIVYQEAGGIRKEVTSSYTLTNHHLIGFEISSYDKAQPLVIDPVLEYSTYLGGSDFDIGQGVAVDAAGTAYVTGHTFSSDFPTTPGAYDTTWNTNSNDVFVTKLDAAGANVVYSTYLGGSGDETGEAIRVDATGSAFVTGSTPSSDFPTTPGAYDTVWNGSHDAFVTKLDASGANLLYSTYLGGSDHDYPLGLAIDVAGNAFVGGYTDSANFPTTAGAFDTSWNGREAFVTKLNTAGANLAYSTYLGGTNEDMGTGIAIDGGGSAYVTGFTFSNDFPTTPGAYDTTRDAFHDSFVTKLDAAGASLTYSTYLGGNNSDAAQDIAVDASGSAYVTGYTDSTNFPTTPGAYDTSWNGDLDVFVTRLNVAGSNLAYSTYLGGSGEDFALGIAVDLTGSAYVTGNTRSANFPTTDGAYDTSWNSGTDAFLTKLSATGSSLAESTFLGGLNDDYGVGIAVDVNGGTYVVGYTYSIDFPTTIGAYDTTLNGNADTFVSKFGPSGEICPHSSVIATIAVENNPLGLSLNAVTNRIYVANFSSNSVSVIDGNTHTVIATIPVGINPHGAGVNTLTNRIYVPNFSSNTVSVIDGVTNAVIATVGVGNGPRGVDVNEVTNRIYVANKNSTDVSVIDGSTNSVIAAVPVTSLPLGVGVVPTSNRIYVANLGGSTVSIIDGATNTNIGSIPVGNSPLGIDVDLATNRVYVTNTVSGTLSVIDDGTSTVIATVPVGAAPYGVGVNSITSGVYAANYSDNTVSIVDGMSNSVIQTLGVGNQPSGVAVNTLTNRVYVANYGSNTVSVIACAGCVDDPDGDGVCNEIGDNCPMTANPDQADADHDGVGDACDQCPSDPNKTVPGVCGCGVPDTDTDGDGMANCHDNCPTTYNPDQRDTDGDGVGDVCTPFQFPAGGEFVVGNLANLAGNATVYFWGSQWSQNNPMSGGSGPNAFKGFENGTATPTCGSTWTSRPGNSSNPPATIPQFMAVIVSSSVVKNGSTISGNVKKIIVVQTNIGYGPSPGHAGTGRVVAIICSSP